MLEKPQRDLTKFETEFSWNRRIRSLTKANYITITIS